MSDANAGKRAAGRAAADLVKSGQKIGLGSGSTFLFALERLAERIAQEKLEIAGLPTSEGTAAAARQLGVPLCSFDEVDVLDLAIDGADEVNPQKVLIKGGGATLLREKIVAGAAREMVVVVDEGKLVSVLGKAFLLPVEVVPFGWQATKRNVAALGCKVQLRMNGDQPLRTDNDNLIFDCQFEKGIGDPAFLHDELNRIPGVCENGLFVGVAGRVIVGDSEGKTRVIP